MFQSSGVVKLGNTAETSVFFSVSSLAKGFANTLWRDPRK